MSRDEPFQAFGDHGVGHVHEFLHISPDIDPNLANSFRSTLHPLKAWQS
jgi:hypothetical protein